LPRLPRLRSRQRRGARKPALIEVKSPLLGIYYRAPKPGEPSFVEVGSKVDVDTVIGIVEVMKLMNSVPAGVKGEVVEITGRNGELIEHGELLLLVRPEA
jgi:acetyl-CoA carboxylase biotin carboxyl carrier protein